MAMACLLSLDSDAIVLTDFRRTPAHVMGVFELTPQQLNALDKGGLQVTVAFSGSTITLAGKFEQGMIVSNVSFKLIEKREMET